MTDERYFGGAAGGGMGAQPRSETDAQELVRIREMVAELMIAKGFATGHGDTIRDLLAEFAWQLTEARYVNNEMRARLRELLEALDSGNLQMNSPDIDADPPERPHPWHEEWLHHARKAVA